MQILLHEAQRIKVSHSSVPRISSQVKDTPVHVKQNCLESYATKPKELPHSVKRRCLRIWGIFTGVLKVTLNAYNYH